MGLPELGELPLSLKSRSVSVRCLWALVSPVRILRCPCHLIFRGGRYVTLDKEGEGAVEFTLTADGQVTNPVTYKSIGDDNTDQLLLTLVKGMNVKYIGAEADRAEKYTVFVHISFKDDCQQY